MRLVRAAAVVATLSTLAIGLSGGERVAMAAEIACTDGTIEATVTLKYDERVLGDVTGLFLDVYYPDGLAVPGKGGDPSVRERVKSALETKSRIVPVDDDTNGDGREDRIRALVITTERAGLPAGPVARIGSTVVQVSG